MSQAHPFSSAHAYDDPLKPKHDEIDSMYNHNTHSASWGIGGGGALLGFTGITAKTLGGGGLLNDLGPLLKDFSAWLAHAPGRAIIGYFMFVLNGIGSGINFHEMGKAYAKQKKLTEIGDNFEASAGGLFACASEDRSNPQKPECYCFTSQMTKNTSRSNSQVCQTLFANRRSPPPSSYSASALYNQGCIDSNKQADPQCACKKSSKKCFSFSLSNNSNYDTGAIRMANAALKPINQMANGSFQAGAANVTGMASNAMKMRKHFDKILADPKNKKFAKLFTEKQKELSKQMKDVSQKIAASLPAQQPNSMPTDAKSAMATLEKELKEVKSKPQDLSAPGTPAAGTSKGDDLDFGMSESALSAQQMAMQKNLEKQDLDYDQNTINGSSGNIFQVLSNRYMRSGMRRLFDDEGKTSADKPAQTDITQ